MYTDREGETSWAFEHGDAASVERVVECVHEVDLDRIRLVRKFREFGVPFAFFHISLASDFVSVFSLELVPALTPFLGYWH